MIEPGLYECISEVFIRREPRVIDNVLGHNRVGKLTVGTQRQVYDVITNKDNTTWGRISEPDSAGISQWVCIKGLNRTYMKLVEDNNPEIETLMDLIAYKLGKLEAWAHTMGYKG